MGLSTEHSDEFLFSLIKKGDRRAFEVLYNRYKSILILHASRMLKDRTEAEDVIHDLFVVLWTKREELFIQKEVRFYLYSSLRNRILKVLAHKKVGANYIATLPDDHVSTGSTDDLIREKLLTLLIEREIENLPPKMKAVFELSRKSNLSHREIAEMLDISEQTVRKHIQHALKILKVKISVLKVLFF